MARLKDYDALWDHVEGFEGRRGGVYTDTAGHPTTGIGFNLDRGDADAKLRAPGVDPGTVHEGAETLDDERIDTLFEPELLAAIEGSRRLIPCFDALSAARQHVCVDLTFNLGAAGFGAFRKTLEAINADDYEAAARELEASRWFRQVGRRGPANVAWMRAD